MKHIELPNEMSRCVKTFINCLLNETDDVHARASVIPEAYDNLKQATAKLYPAFPHGICTTTGIRSMPICSHSASAPDT
jgi:hypothetical protein